jgi:hypothetical protein
VVCAAGRPIVARIPPPHPREFIRGSLQIPQAWASEFVPGDRSERLSEESRFPLIFRGSCGRKKPAFRITSECDGKEWGCHGRARDDVLSSTDADFQDQETPFFQGFARLGGVFRPPRTRYEIPKASRNADFLGKLWKSGPEKLHQSS